MSQESASLFAASLAHQGLQPRTISAYLSAVRHLQIAAGLGTVSRAEWPFLQYIIRGIKRSKADSPQRVRLPITGRIMQRLQEILCSTPDFESVLVWAACCLAFFGFLRAGEFTTNTNEPPAIRVADLSTDSNASPSVIRVRLRRSKTDQFGQGTWIYVSRTNSTVCPVSALLNYLAVRPHTANEVQLFVHQDSSPLSRDQFVHKVRTALAAAGIDSSKYAGHSFRIGAATAAAQAGCPDHLIKALGRWESEAYQLYVRIPPETLAAVSHSLARTSE